MQRKFFGWWITAAAFVTFGLAVGIPYYNIGFFYDYFQRSFGWQRADVTLGFPVAALLTIWVGPLVMHRFNAFVPAEGTTGDPKEMPLLAGEGVGLVRAIEPAGDVVRAMARSAAA